MSTLKRAGCSFWVAAVLLLFISAGCAMNPDTRGWWKQPVVSSVLVAQYTEKPVVMDGNLNDVIWKDVPVYYLDFARDLYLPFEKRRDQRPGIDRLMEPGEVRLAWDDKYLYIGIKFTDSDIVQESEENQQHHYASGDVVEIFLKPEKSTWYWEIYGTPNEKKTVFWYPGRGRAGLKSCSESDMNLDDILIATQIKGTLNNWKDKDEYWTMEMAIPVKGLTAHGDILGPGSEWKILIARYNYSIVLPWREFSMVPQLSVTNYHLLEEYGILRFEK
jgi:hypothetical protein